MSKYDILGIHDDNIESRIEEKREDAAEKEFFNQNPTLFTSSGGKRKTKRKKVNRRRRPKQVKRRKRTIKAKKTKTKAKRKH